MKAFPKKYNTQELRNWSQKYKETYNNSTENKIFSLWNLSISEKLSYQDFFYFYVRDFFNHIKFKEDKDSSLQSLFIISSNQIKNLCTGYEFFSKKNQTLEQVWTNKLERRIISTCKKNINTNNKIIESYLSSPHKIYIPDSELYLYILKQFNSLRDQWKLKHEKKIWYRSFKLQTSIPPQYITRKEEKKPYYILKYFVWAKCEALPIYIEDIDLCCWDVALLIHPKDKRYNKYIWKNAIIPLCNRQIPIIWDENVNIAKNNWIQRVCPCYDQESIAIAEKYWLPTDIFVFNQQWLYTDFIHESAFIWQERNKYYSNIEWFIKDIWNLEEKWEKTIKTPYLSYINERLTPYKIDQITLDLSEEKQTILNKIFNRELSFSFLDSDFWEILNEIDSLEQQLEELKNLRHNTNKENIESNEEDDDTINMLNTKVWELQQIITNEIDQYLPNFLVCNNQLQYWRKIPLINDWNWNYSFFNIEEQYINQKEKPLQLCFDFALLSLIRIWTFWKISWNENNKTKLCEYNKIIRILSENDKKIEYFIQYLSTLTSEKPEYEKFSQIIQNLTDENNPSVSDCLKLVDNSKLLEKEWNYLLVNLAWMSNDIIDSDFIQLSIPCYLHDKNIKINEQIIFKKEERSRIFQELLIQELLLWKNISNKFLEISYDEDNEFLWDKQLSKLQLNHSQRDLFSLYWENPIRLNFLIHQTYNQKEILLNNIFLKQIWNAIRLCLQKGFLPQNIESTLKKQPDDLEDVDTWILYNLNSLYDYRKNIETYEEYRNFFIKFKSPIQDSFFSRYLEIQKIKTSKNVQFVCSYFFNFLLNVLYPLVPEFVDALQYMSERNFLTPIQPIQLNKTIDYNIHLIYDTFLKIKNIKIECNIKQHESCNLFIKSNPMICELFTQYEQIFINYFHISDITYLRLHEPTPLWYEVFSNDSITIGIQHGDFTAVKEQNSIESIEKDIKDLDDKLNLIRQRLQLLPEWEDRKKAEKEYAKTKEEIENLTIKHSLLSSK